MKKLFFSLFFLASLTLIFSSCGSDKDDPEPQKTPEELAIIDLTGEGTLVWAVAGGGSVIRDGRSETNLYQDFELTLSANNNNKTYSTINSNNLFDASGNWAFVGENFDIISFLGNRPASGTDISFTRTGDSLVLTFSIIAPGGRENPSGAVAGNYTFNLRLR